MPARVTILCGPARCGKTERLLVRYRDMLARRSPGAALWLAPTWRAATEVRQRLLDETLPGCFQPGVMTFGNFAETVLHAGEIRIRPMTRLMKRELVRQIILEQSSRGRLGHFQSIAKTAGLVDLVCEFISELKRLEIWPDDFRRACAVRGLDAKDVELSEIYDVYQQSLLEHGLFDAEGRFWSARDVLAKEEGREKNGQERGLGTSVPSRFALIVADGFTDFTRTQHEILAILAGRGEEMFITLPLDSSSRRDDLFAKPVKTLDELRRRHAGATVEQLDRPANSDWPAMTYLERALFQNPRSPQSLAPRPSPLAPALNIEILAAARQVGEIELIAGRIKRLLVDGEARPGEIAVVFRSPQDASRLIDEVFGRLGIPVVLESGQTLDHSPALRSLARLLQLDLDDWPFDRLLAVLGSNYFQPNWPEWRDARFTTVEQTIRQLQIPRGRELLIEQLTAVGGDSSRRSALAITRRLAAVFDALPQRTTLPEWAKAWRRLADETGLHRAMTEPGEAERVRGGEGETRRVNDSARELASNSQIPSLPVSKSPTLPLSPSPSLSDRRAWDRLMKALAEGDTLATWIEQRPPELDRRAAFEALVDIVGTDRVGHSGDESGCVRVLSAESVRSLRISYLFLAGLSEKAFPPPDREDRLYSEADYLRLIDAGLPLVARTERTREEMLLFYEAVTRATKRLYLSYPALDESAQPLLPSPFLSEIEEAFAPGQIPRVERTDLSPIPSEDEPLCQSDFRVKAVATALAGNVALLAGLMSGEGREQRAEGWALQCPTSSSPLPSPLSSRPSLAAGLELIYLRQDRDRFGPAEGMLQSPETQSYLATQFHPQHVFAATELERYASCPFRFFLERILKVEPLDDLALEFDVRERGRVVHDVLATFHQQVNARLGRPGSPLELDETEFDALLAAAIQKSLPPEPKNPVQAALREVDRRLVVEWLSQYRGQVERYDAQWKDFSASMVPELFEASFGRSGAPPPSTDKPFEIVRKGQTIRITGRIDRIDTGTIAGQAAFNVLDYKSGGTIKLSADSVAAGTTLQLPLYALAAMELLFADRDVLPWRVGYWYVRDDGFKPKQALAMYDNVDGRIELNREWEDIRDGLGDIVAGLVQSIRESQFPVCSTDDHCTGHCPFSTVCRINQVRSLEKTWHPTASE